MTEHWHLDKRVPIALIVTIALQTSAGIWWAATINERMMQVEQRQTSQSSRSERVDQVLATQGERLAVLTEAVANTNRNIERLSGEIVNTNELLRELLLQNGAPKK